MQHAAHRPVDILRVRGPTTRSGPIAGKDKAGRFAFGRDRSGLGREPPGLWRPESLETAQPRRTAGGALHRGPFDAEYGPTGSRSWPEVQDDNSGRSCAATARSCRSRLHGDPTESALGRRSDLTWQRGVDLCTWPSSSTCSPARSSAGER